MAIQRFEDIEAWQLARQLTRAIYQHTKKPLFSHDYGLKDQIRRAAGSTMHNIAEGFDAESNAEFMRFLRYSKPSCSEVQSQLYIALDEKYLNPTDFEALYELTGKTRAAIHGFITYLVRYESTRSTGCKP